MHFEFQNINIISRLVNKINMRKTDVKNLKQRKFAGKYPRQIIIRYSQLSNMQEYVIQKFICLYKSCMPCVLTIFAHRKK